MTVSQQARRLREEYMLNASHNASYTPLSNNEFEELMDEFYWYAEKFGFYVDPKEAVKKNGKVIYEFQRKIARSLLKGIFQQITTEVNISICRQTGKTEFTGLATGFIFNEFYKTFGAPVGIIIVAPEKGTATIPFKVLRKYIRKDLLYDGSATSRRIESVRGDTIELFGIYESSDGQMAEGRTSDLIIRDEAHAGSDEKYSDQVEPTMLTKRGVSVFLGNGGFKKCLYFDRIQEAQRREKDGTQFDPKTNTESVLIRYTYNEIKPYFEKLADLGLKKCRVQLDNMARNINKHGGMKSKVVRKNYFCLWETEFQNPMTAVHIDRCKDPSYMWIPNSSTDLYLGFDIAGVHDRSVCTVIDQHKNVVDWLVVKDTDKVKRAREQFELLFEMCEERQYLKNIVSIGVDATGDSTYSSIELLEEVFPGLDILEYRFTAGKKHEMYIKFVESITTTYDEDRMTFNPNHKWAKQFETECIELTRTPRDGAIHDKWAAPKREGAFDDFIAAGAIAIDVRARDLSVYTGLGQQKKERQKHRTSTSHDFFSRYVG